MMMSSKHQTVPLSLLLKLELANEKIERPEITYGQCFHTRKGEDFTLIKTECQRILADGVVTFSVFALFDGHNGSAAAIYTKENLLNNVMGALPTYLKSDEWTAALPRALVAGFVKTDKEFTQRGQVSGTTVTLVVIEGATITVASVGDSSCILKSANGGIYHLSADHRLQNNVQERERVTACGGEVGPIINFGIEMGPLRCWPGGLCLSRSIGDVDIGEYIVPVPYVTQVKLSSAGGRLIISSDGVWDALSAETAFKCSHGMLPDASAMQIVMEAVKVKGLRDDTTCIVIDIEPPEKPKHKKQGTGVFTGICCIKTRESSPRTENKSSETDVVEVLFEEGSASLSERLDMKYPFSNMFMCAVCQAEVKPEEGISIHAGSSNTRKVQPWDGPLLCPSCQEKKEAMEGKIPSGDHRYERY